MIITKRSSGDIPRESAHGGSVARKVYASAKHLKSTSFEMMTHGFLPGGQCFDRHDHYGVEEIMIVLTGKGTVCDRDGEYTYAPGDVFVFPAGVQHKIVNPTDGEHECMFVRVKV